MTKKRTPYFFMAAAAILVIWLPTILFKLPYYEYDDYVMNYILNGAYPGNTTNLIYPQLVYGMILNIPASLMPSVNWFCVAFLAALTADMCVFIFISYKLKNTAAMICTIFIGLTLPLFLTFTVVAYITIAAGLSLVVYLAFSGEKKLYKYFIAAIFIVFGYMIRGNTVVSAVLMFAPLIIVLFFNEKTSIYKRIQAAAAMCMLGIVLYICANSPHAYREAWKWILFSAVAVSGLIIGIKSGVYKELFFTVFIICALVLAINIAENILVDAVWREFSDFTKARAGVLDQPHSRYERVKDGLSQIGISEAGHNILFEWVFTDKQVFSTEALVKIRDVLNTVYTRISVKSWLGNFKNIACILVPAAAAVIFGIQANKKGRRVILFTLIILVLMYIALLIRLRFVYRVAVPLCIIGIIGMIIASGINGSGLKSKKIIAATAAICVVAVGAQYIYVMKNAATPKHFKEAEQYLENHPEEHFVVKGRVYNMLYFDQVPALYVKKETRFQNAVKAGSGDTYSPRFYYQMKDWNISNPDRLLMELLNNETLRYVGNEGEDLRTYLEEQSGKKVTAEVEKSFGDEVYVYKFSAVETG